MSITIRTQRATNPHAASATTNWLDIDGTSGVAAISHNTGQGYQQAGFPRVTWTTATTALSGGIQYTQTGLSASTAYALTLWCRSSKNQTLRATATFRNSSNATVNTVNGSAVAVAANVWTPVPVTGTSGSSVTNVVLSAVAFTGGSFWANGDTLDAVALIETGSTFNPYYDGATAHAFGITYAWVGTVNASNSTATIYTPTLTLTGLTTAPCPRVNITIADIDPSVNEVTLWRTSDGKRRAVRGTREWKVTGGSDAVTDYEVPLNTATQYELEVIEGISAKAVTTPASITVTDTKGWIQDPLDPGSAVPLYADLGPDGEPSLSVEALAQFDYEADVSLVKVMGSSEPIAFIGQRMAASSVPFHMFTDQAQQSTNLRNLLRQAGPVLIRPLPVWSNGLPVLCYLSVKTVSEKPVNEAYGGQIIEWHLSGDLVAAPAVNIVVLVTTYGTVQALWTTYQQAQTALAAKTYLQVKLSPSGA